jgi:mycofactocin precursor peptide peptidase
MSNWALGDLAWPDVAERAADGALLAVPLGSTEQHGPHLPLSTDTDIAVELCARLAAARHDVLVAAPVPYGSSGEHAGFPGTLSIGQAALEMLVIELGRSAAQTFRHLLLVCGHGGNAEPLARAVALLREESHDVMLFMSGWSEGDPHAGHEETSMMLELAPSRVLMDRAAAGDTRPLSQTWPLMRSSGVRAVTESGVLGDPTRASAEQGSALLNVIAARLADDVARWRQAVRA